MMQLHRRLSAWLSLIALITFISGAGLDAPSVIPAGLMLLIAIVIQPTERTTRFLEPFWRVAAVLLALRAGLQVIGNASDPVLPMVDLLLLLLCAESLRERDASGDARHFALTFALLIAAAAYRPGALFGLLFVVYVICATLVLVVGHLARQAAARHITPARPERRFLARIAALSTVVLLVSASVFLFFPRVSQGWAARGAPLVTRAVIGFSDRVTIGSHGARLEGNPEVVLRVEFPGGAPPNVTSLHWRGRSYNRFDGITWSRFEYRGSALNEAARWPGELIEQVVYARPLGNANVLFGLHPVLDIGGITRIQPRRLPSGDFLYYGEAEPAYRVRSRAGLPHPDSLRKVRIDTDPQTLVHLQLPRLTERMQALADSFRYATTNAYDHALAVENWLQTQFSYTLDLPATRAETSLDHFLFERRAGHCEYFSTAMAVLLRAADVPTRNVNGFLGGTWNEFGGFLTVTQNNAHSWVEVYFPGYGWVPFDPTPAGSAGGSGAAAARFSAFRSFFDGIEHRWGKWVLDYDMNKQRDLLRRATAPLTGDDASDTGTPESEQRWPWKQFTAVAFLIALLLAVRNVRAHRRTRYALVTRTYLALRRAYERAGLVSTHTPPLAFASVIGNAPGATDARRAIDLYMRERFGGVALTEVEKAELKRRVKAARREIRGVKRKKGGKRSG
jgi:transglutaminase-like putative cysteine protease